KVVRRADPSRFFFALVGEVFWESLGADQHELREFCDSPPENCLVQTGYLQEERELNSIIAAADILYAVYSNFRNSSNTLTKAAIFEKPVIVSDDYLMGERVEQFDLGATVRTGDIDDIVMKLERLRKRPKRQFGFAIYRQAHSVAALKKNLAE